jgi:hypothetical protein
MILPFSKKQPKVEDKDKPKFMSKEWLEDFFIPRNFIDVVFILICFILMWYALTYDIPNAKIPVICANLWNKWAAEKAGLLGGLYMFNNTSFNPITIQVTNATPVYIPINLTNLTVH